MHIKYSSLKLHIVILFQFFVFFSYGQNENPFIPVGYEAPVMTKEKATDDTTVFIIQNKDTAAIVRYVILDTKNHKIITLNISSQVLTIDSISPTTISRWFSPDAAHQHWSPYLAMGNSWSSGVDPDGNEFGEYTIINGERTKTSNLGDDIGMDFNNYAKIAPNGGVICEYTTTTKVGEYGWSWFNGYASSPPTVSQQNIYNFVDKYAELHFDVAKTWAESALIGKAGELLFAVGESYFAAKGSTQAVEGIYEFTAASGKTYVGQSGNIAARLEQHIASGKLLTGTSVRTTEVLGGKTAREIAEQLRINSLGGIKYLENIRNPIGPARQYLFLKP